MPYTIRKLPKKDLYRVTSTKTGRVASKGTTKKKAQAQVKLLYALNNPSFIKK